VSDAEVPLSELHVWQDDVFFTLPSLQVCLSVCLSVCLIISELQRDVGLGCRGKILERKAVKMRRLAWPYLSART